MKNALFFLKKIFSRRIIKSSTISLLTVTLLFTAAAFVWCGAELYQSQKNHIAIARQHSQRVEISDKLKRLGENLTQDPNILASTDLFDEESEKYQHDRRDFKETLREIKESNLNPRTDQLSGQLSEIEESLAQTAKQAFDLILNKKFEEGRRILRTPEYEAQKTVFEDAVQELAAEVKEFQDKPVDNQENFLLLILVGITFLVALLTSVATIFSLYKSRQQLTESNSKKEIALEALRRSETKARELFENANDIIFTTDLEENFVTFNKAGKDATGYTDEEILQMKISDLVTPASLDVIRQMRTHKLLNPGATKYEVEIVTKHKTTLTFEINTSLIYENEKIAGFQGIARDVTESKQIMLAEKKATQYQNLFKHANDAIIIFAPENEIVLEVNDKACRMYERTRENFVGQSLREVSRDVDYGIRELEKILSEGSRNNLESVHLRGNGEEFNVMINAVVIDYQSTTAVLCIIRDVTARKILENNLREREQHLLSVTNSAQDAIVSSDNHGKIVFWNEGAKQIFGYTTEEIIGQSLSCLIPEKYRSAHTAGMKRYTVTGEKRVIGKVVELEGLRKDGTVFPLEFSLGVWETATGKYFTGIMRDITERRRSQQIQLLREREVNLRGEITGFFANADEMLTHNLTNCAEAILKYFSDVAIAKIWLLDARKSVLELQANVKIPALSENPTDLISARKLQNDLFAFERTINVVKDVSGDSQFDDQKWIKESGIESFANFPLLIEDQLIGTIEIFSQAAFDIETVNVLVGIAEIISQNLERRRTAEALAASEQSYRYLSEGIMHQVWTLDPRGRFDYANQQTLDYFGKTVDEFRNVKLDEIVHADDLPTVVERWQQADRGKIDFESEYRLRRHDGIYRWYTGRAAISFDGKGNVLRWFGTSTDIHDQKIAEEFLRESEERFRLLVENVADYAIFMLDAEGYVVSWNAGAERVKQYTAHEVIGSHFSRFYTEDDKARNHPAHELKIAAETGRFEEEGWRIRKDGSRFWANVLITALRDENGNLHGYSKITRDITERKQAEEKLLQNAFYDSLTNLANRSLFMDHLRLVIERNRRKRKTMFAVLFLDFDRFKVINDSLGHAEGDKFLQMVARRLENLLRDGDLIARLGGDEFTILVNDLSGESEVVQIAERILEDLKESFNLGGQEIFMSASIGIALSTAKYQNAEAMLRDADIAMYQAKAKGKAQYQIFNQTMYTQATTRLQIETELRRALARNELRTFYQPIINLETNRIAGFEALMRWQHPERGMIPPADFIPAAEENGLIVPLGYYILEESCRQIRKWQRLNPLLADLTVSVNLSSKQFLQSDLAEQIDRILSQTKFSAYSLKLEITESHLMENSAVAIRIIDNLRRLGVELSLDDFGTGYSSLSYLHRLSVNFLKIDRSFVDRMIDSPENGEIVHTIIKLAQNLKMQVIAEGIETGKQLEYLKNLKCQFGQGYFFARPADVEETEKFIYKNLNNFSSLNNPPVIDLISNYKEN